MSATRTFAVTLTIPDNEAFTALETLGRLGIPVARVVRADIWQFEVGTKPPDVVSSRLDAVPPDANAARPAALPTQPSSDTPVDDLARTVASIETIHNPNKHRLAERPSDRPVPGEVWIASRDEATETRVAGRAVPGVRSIRRRTAWRLLDGSGRDVAPADLDRAVETFLCNPAFQVAITA